MIWLILAGILFCQIYAVSLYLTPKAARWGTRFGLIDHPNEARKDHGRAIPRSGGIAVYVSFWAVLITNVFLAALLLPHAPFLPREVGALAGNLTGMFPQLGGLFLGSLMIFLLGLLDDRDGLPPLFRLAVQILACVPLLATGTVMKLMLPEVAGQILTILWVVLLTNSFNFLDNMNGLTSGVGVICASGFAVFAALSGEWFLLCMFTGLAAATLGFWHYNFPKARIFLGDAGSTTIGYLLATLAILTTWYEPGVPTQLPWLIPIVILGIPLFDTLSVLWIRYRAGKPFMQGDTNHLSHRLVSLGMTKTEAVLFIYGATLTLALLAFPLRKVDWTLGVLHVTGIFLIFFLLHWLERVSYRKRLAAPS